MKPLRCWVLALAAIATPVLAAVPDWSAPQVRAAVANQVFTRLRSRVQEKAPAATQALDRQVVLSVDVDGTSEPHSVHNYQGRKVVVPDAFIAKTINIARFMQLMQGAKDVECAMSYKSHMEKTGSRTAPEGYLDRAEPACAMLKARLPLTQAQELRAQQALVATLVFAYLHELGHQYQNHGHPPMPYNVTTKENRCAFLRARDMQRQLEYEADSFAVATLIHIGEVGLLVATSNLWLPPPEKDPRLVVPDGMLSQRLADHPYSPLRFTRILGQASEALSRQPAQNAELLQIIREMADVERRTAAVIADVDAKLNPC